MLSWFNCKNFLRFKLYIFPYILIEKKTQNKITGTIEIVQVAEAAVVAAAGIEMVPVAEVVAVVDHPLVAVEAVTIVVEMIDVMQAVIE